MIKTEALETSQTDLDLINQWTLAPLTAEQVYTFSAKLIDDKPTANNRVWSTEWQAANTPKFLGIPVTLNHDTSDANLVIGRIYHAEQTGNAITGRVFVPLTTETGKTATGKIKAGQLKAMSINARANKTKAENGIDVILPSDDDRILEVSFVSVGGCETCGITKETPTSNAKTECKSDPLVEFAISQLADLRAEYIRNAAFALGTNVSKAIYSKVAESVDPMTLKTLTEDLKRAYESNKTSKAESLPASNDIKTQIEDLRNLMGV
jgi:hypothetical protein